ncbi:MAG: DeoR/GlpR family DNA-binding transcription regulator [Candidatus Hydrogenedentes bacterium]|nr:DeoR/GlpR family DNA-binding transcription regulator [Candidatus Hydrogenedentota bacterium]
MKNGTQKKQTATTRRSAILERLSAVGEVFVIELASDFEVTPMTIRRDLEALEGERALTRTHGGAIFSKKSVAEFAFLERNRTSIEEKQAIARATAALVEPGMRIVIDTGTTTLEVARALGGIERLQVLTSSLAVASALHTHSNVSVVLLGGDVGKDSPDLNGSLTEDNLRKFRVPLAILRADVLDERGLYTTDLGIARVSEAMIDVAEDTVLVADSRKFSRTSFVKFADWSQIGHLVTDRGVTRNHRVWLKDCVKDVRYAKGGRDAHRH